MKYAKLRWSFFNRRRDQNREVLMWGLGWNSHLKLRIIWTIVEDGTENIARWNASRVVA